MQGESMREIANSDDQLSDASLRLGLQAGDRVTVGEGNALMDNDLKQHLEGMETRLNAKFATMFAEMHDIFATKADLERVETALLTEFHKWASPAEMRAKSHAQAIRLMDTELESMGERIDKLEGKKPS
jgi:hypothetical protein